MAITLTTSIEPSADFPLLGAKDVGMADGTRLDVTVQQAMAIVAAMRETIAALQNTTAPAKNVDLSKFESEGKIVQTGTDGSVITYTFTFDAETGNPTKITDSKGNTTTLTW